ncbi:MAG TPA: epoxide hydrolase [Acidimicrobiales bacterium]|nr:epoxide hydrolase [Acidimicrobiales bacterium]
MADVTPFSVDIADEQIEDLRDRLHATRFPEPETVEDWSQGIPLSYVQDLCTYWADEYDWRSREARLNQFPQFTTQLDDLNIHFIHARSPHDDALPLLMTHGWPGSVVEFMKVIEPLTNPPDAADAFHVMCPSLPGYGWSDKPTTTGWGTQRISKAWTQLMARLGYERYVAQGGDWGSMVTLGIGAIDVDHCAALHTNMIIAPPGKDMLADLTAREQQALADYGTHDQWGTGYSKQQSTRPQTLGYSLVDSPAGQMAWIVEKFWQWTDCDGHPENVLTRDELLDNVMLYWLPGTGASSARLYWESFNNRSFEKVVVPTCVSIFPKEIFRPSRRFAEPHYDIRYWNELEKGGHFAAFEQPDAFVNELREAFRQFRQ